MDKFVQLANDIVKLLGKYGGSYVSGIANTLILALVATLIGCLIGFVCGILNTIPYGANDPLPKRVFLKLIRALVRLYVEVFRSDTGRPSAGPDTGRRCREAESWAFCPGTGNMLRRPEQWQQRFGESVQLQQILPL